MHDKFAIRITRQFYGPYEKRSLAQDERDGHAVTFGTRQEAQQHIDEYLDAGPYYTNHNESGRPEYAVVPVGRLPQYLAWQL